MNQDFHDLRLSLAPDSCLEYRRPTTTVIVNIEESQTSLFSKIKDWLAINL